MSCCSPICRCCHESTFPCCFDVLNAHVDHHVSLTADPFKNDVNFVLSVLTLEELGATGNKGLTLLLVRLS